MSNMIYVPGEVITVVVNNVPYVVAAAHPNFNKVVEAAKVGDFNAIPDLANVARAVKTFGGGKITVDEHNQVVLFKGEELHNYAVDRLLTMMAEGFDVDPLVNFLTNLMDNPSKRAVDELYGFLEYGKMPITPDGHFLAYKRVRDDFKSVHDGKTDNSIGNVVEMDRNKVDDNKDSTCSYGLHFCSLEYLKSYMGSKIVILKINPRDVVSIPTDYNNTKGRACRYEVVDVLSEGQFNAAVAGFSAFNAPVVDRYENEDADRDFPEDFDELEQSHLDDVIEVVVVDIDDLVIEAYHEGYKSGRFRWPAENLNGWRPELVVAYNEGYADGKGHKAKKYK